MSFSADFSAVQLQLGTYLSRSLDVTPYLDFVGEHQKARIRNRIQVTKLDPDGVPWAPWAPFTAEKRDLAGTFDRGLLWETGELLHSIVVAVDGNFGVDIGTTVWYAAAHQEGKGKLPEREIFGWEKELFPFYETALLAYMETGRP